MTKKEILATRYGEMLDMINCYLIANGLEEPKRKRKKFTFDEVLELR